MTIKLTIEAPEDKHTFKSDMAFGITMKRVSGNQTEAKVFLMGATNSRDIIQALESLSGAAAMVMLRIGLTPDFIVEKIGHAVADGAGGALDVAQRGDVEEKELEEDSKDTLDTLLERLSRTEKLFEALNKVKRICKLTGQDIPDFVKELETSMAKGMSGNMARDDAEELLNDLTEKLAKRQQR